MDNETQQVISELIDHSLKDDPMSFEFIRSLSGYFYCRKRRKALKAVIKVLKSCSKRILKRYCKSIGTENQNFTRLLAFTTLQSAYDFYKQDYRTITTMIGEYEIYLMCTCFTDILLFRKRPERNLTDYRRYL